MAIKNYVKPETVDKVRKTFEDLLKEQKNIEISVKKSKTKKEKYTVKIEGVYPSFCTVKNLKLNVAFTIRYVDVIKNDVEIVSVLD